VRSIVTPLEDPAHTPEESRWRSVAAPIGVGLVGIFTVVAWTLLETRSLRPQPALEDAAMLFRYANNLSNGFGISWNSQEAPGLTDGATDLGFVLSLAPLIFVGIPVTTAAMVMNLGSVFALGTLLGWAGRRLWQLPWIAMALIVVLIFSGPVNRYVSSGFSPPTFGLLLTVIAVLTLAVVTKPALSRGRWLLLGSIASLAGWWRPEGFALGGIVLAASVACAIPVEQQRRFAMRWNWLALIVGFLIPALAWVAFRLIYFGHLLPSSAVLKSAGLNRSNAVESLQVITLALLPLLAVIAFLALIRPTRIWVLLLAVLVASAVWMPVIMHLNWWNRMQWPLVPALAVVAIASVTQVPWSLPRMPGPVPLVSATLVMLCAIAILRTYSVPGPVYTQYQPHTSMSAALAGVDTSMVRLATSEAGLVPLAITGTALDTYGYNNYAIASSNGSALEYELNRLRPNMIIVNGPAPTELAGALNDPNCATADLTDYLGQRWLDMSHTMMDYARTHGLGLVRSTETGRCVTFSIYAATDLPVPVMDAIRSFRTESHELVAGRS
jgi:hypothetical protein